MYTVKAEKRARKRLEHLPKNMLNRLIERVMITYPLAWNRLFKRLHFGDGAAARYDYAPRQGERSGMPVRGSYTHKKLRLYGHTRALEFSGRGMREALANDFATAGHRRRGGFWARATLPRVFNLRNPKGRTDPPKEVTTVLASENKVLGNIAQEKLLAEFRRHSGYRG